MTDHRDAAILTLQPVRGDARRIRIEHADGIETQFWAVHEAWDGGRWRTQGREPLRDASVEGGLEVA